VHERLMNVCLLGYDQCQLGLYISVAYILMLIIGFVAYSSSDSLYLYCVRETLIRAVNLAK